MIQAAQPKLTTQKLPVSTAPAGQWTREEKSLRVLKSVEVDYLFAEERHFNDTSLQCEIKFDGDKSCEAQGHTVRGQSGVTLQKHG